MKRRNFIKRLAGVAAAGFVGIAASKPKEPVIGAGMASDLARRADNAKTAVMSLKPGEQIYLEGHLFTVTETAIEVSGPCLSRPCPNFFRYN